MAGGAQGRTAVPFKGMCACKRQRLRNTACSAGY